MTTRRAFIGVLGGAAGAWPVVARAQQYRKSYTIGLLNPGASTVSLTVFINALREFGWTENNNIVFERRHGENRPERLHEIAAELARLDVDVIVALGTPGPLPRSKPPRRSRSSWRMP